MKTIMCAGLMLTLLGMVGCRQATTVGPVSESYSVEANEKQLVAGENRPVEILVRYHRSQQFPATLKYKVQLSVPGDLTIAPTTWVVQQDLTGNDAGFNHTTLANIEVAPDAAPGDREVTVTITPAQGASTSNTLVFQVTKKDR